MQIRLGVTGVKCVILLIVLCLALSASRSIEKTFAREASLVAIRIDDVQDYWNNDIQVMIINWHIENGIPATLGIIAGDFGDDEKVVSMVNEAIRKGFEVANHGWDNRKMSDLPKNIQFNLILNSKRKIAQITGYDPSTYIPARFEFDDKTLESIIESGHNIISTEINKEEPVLHPKNGLAKIPCTVDTAEFINDTFFMKDHERLVKEFEYSLEAYGYAVILIHPQQFVENGALKIDDWNIYTRFISTLRRKYEFVTMREIAGVEATLSTPQMLDVNKINLKIKSMLNLDSILLYSALIASAIAVSITRIHHKRRYATTFILISLLLILSYYILVAYPTSIPIWDGNVYLLNSRAILNGDNLYEGFRPAFISFIIAALWLITGENWTLIKPLQAIFLVLSAFLLYKIISEKKSELSGIIAFMIFIFNPQVLLWSGQILTHGFSTFFLILGLYLFIKDREKYWILGGLSLALAFISRYTSAIPAAAILLSLSMLKRSFKRFMFAVLGAFIVIIPYFSWLLIKEGAIQFAFSKDIGFSFIPSDFYIRNYLEVFGWSFLLIPVSLLNPKICKDKFNIPFIVWFLSALTFWSSNLANLNPRFIYETIPAFAFIVSLSIEELFVERSKALGVICIGLVILSCYSGILWSSSTMTNFTIHYDPTLQDLFQKIEEVVPKNEKIITNHLSPHLTYFTGRPSVVPWGIYDYSALMGFMKDGGFRYLVIFPFSAEDEAYKLYHGEGLNKMFEEHEMLYTFRCLAGRGYIFRLRI